MFEILPPTSQRGVPVEEQMDRDELFQQLRSYLVELFDVPPERISLNAALREDLDLDSIDAVDLIVKIQELTQVRIDPEQFKTVRTVGDVVERVHDLFATTI
jgi:acyl carrier protein